MAAAETAIHRFGEPDEAGPAVVAVTLPVTTPVTTASEDHLLGSCPPVF
jgi:hypothetical protein